VGSQHCSGTINADPNAELVDFWGKYKGDLWEDDGDGYEIAPGIKVLRTPGHTEEDASLVVETEQGTYVLTHLWSFPDIKPGKDPLAWNQESLDEHRKKILQIADWIIPGHGNMVKNPKKGQ
jgi:glyoxylase-like metal-dependent hydrolase (beta-lactamase superfamily II)